jgi:hypothetical protein
VFSILAQSRRRVSLGRIPAPFHGQATPSRAPRTAAGGLSAAALGGHSRQQRVKADRVRYDHRTGDVLATGTVDARIGGRRVRAERLRYCAGSKSLELANLQLEGLGGDSATDSDYHRARGNGMGGVPSPLLPHAPASSRMGVPWLHAGLAEAQEDFSHIRGRDGVKIGAGAIVIEGQAFELDPVASRLEVAEAELRLRSPRTRIRAKVLRAALSGRESKSETARIRLEGTVEVQLELPFPLGDGKPARVAVSADRLDARPRLKGSVGFVLAGSPVKIDLPGAGLSLEAPIVSGKIKGRRLLLEGQLRGRLVVVASAFPDRKAARREWVVLAAQALDLAPATARPAVWFAGEGPGSHPRRLVLRNALLEGDKEPRPELVLFRPTWV